MSSSSPSTATLLPAKTLAQLTTHLATELALLDRVVYKNQSQHRLARFWRKVVEVRRIGGKVKESWEGWAENERKRAEGGEETLEKTQEVKGKGRGKKGKVEKGGGRKGELKSLAGLVEKLCLALPKLHAALNQLITLTHFLPLVLVLLGISARLWTVSCALYSYLDAVWEKEGRFGEKKALRRLQAGGVEEEAGEAWKKRSKRELAEEQMRKGRGGFMAREIVELEKGKNNEGKKATGPLPLPLPLAVENASVAVPSPKTSTPSSTPTEYGEVISRVRPSAQSIAPASSPALPLLLVMPRPTPSTASTISTQHRARQLFAPAFVDGNDDDDSDEETFNLGWLQDDKPANPVLSKPTLSSTASVSDPRSPKPSTSICTKPSPPQSTFASASTVAATDPMPLAPLLATSSASQPTSSSIAPRPRPLVSSPSTSSLPLPSQPDPKRKLKRPSSPSFPLLSSTTSSPPTTPTDVQLLPPVKKTKLSSLSQPADSSNKPSISAESRQRHPSKVSTIPLTQKPTPPISDSDSRPRPKLSSALIQDRPDPSSSAHSSLKPSVKRKKPITTPADEPSSFRSSSKIATASVPRVGDGLAVKKRKMVKKKDAIDDIFG